MVKCFAYEGAKSIKINYPISEVSVLFTKKIVQK